MRIESGAKPHLAFRLSNPLDQIGQRVGPHVSDCHRGLFFRSVALRGFQPLTQLLPSIPRLAIWRPYDETNRHRDDRCDNWQHPPSLFHRKMLLGMGAGEKTNARKGSSLAVDVTASIDNFHRLRSRPLRPSANNVPMKAI